METLFGRFPHLVEDIFGLLNGETLSCCSHINKIWIENLENYRIHLIKKLQKCLKNQNVVNEPVEDSVKEEGQNWPKIPFEIKNNIFCGSPRILEHPMALERNTTVEQLPPSDLVKILKYFCDYDGVFFLFLSNFDGTAFVSPSRPNMNQGVPRGIPRNTPHLASDDIPQFLIKLNFHNKVFFESAEELRNQKNIFDVTLNCGEYNFPVHKIVLTVCSPYFRLVF